jgi:hypothetical protein
MNNSLQRERANSYCGLVCLPEGVSVKRSTKERNMKKLQMAILSASVAVAYSANATLLTGTYSISGDPGNQAIDNGNGTFGLTSTPSTYSWVDFVPNQTVTFSQLTGLDAVFTANGGAGGGSPRLWVDLSNGGWIDIYLGPSPYYLSDASGLQPYSSFNLIGNNDPGRYDISHDGPSGATGGSPFTDYATALAAIGGLGVTDVGVAVDGGWSPSGPQDITLNSIDVYASTPVPEPTTMVAGALMLIPFGISAIRIFRRKQAA